MSGASIPAPDDVRRALSPLAALFTERELTELARPVIAAMAAPEPSKETADDQRP